jgi:hypothetical protein
VAAAPYTPTDLRNDPGGRREREAKARREDAELAGQRTERLAALEAQLQTVPVGKRTAEEVRALRALGAKWPKIIFIMWQRHVPYSEEHHLATMARQALRHPEKKIA